MRAWPLSFLILALAAPAWADEVAASSPQTLSVTVYRNPYRGAGSIKLDNLGGFALITETRTVHLPAGESRLRFEGVVDGIQAESAIVTGLPDGVIEKNRDAALLTPQALMRAAIGADVVLVRTNRKTGVKTEIPAKIRSASNQGVVFETAQGVEALRCSGVPETFRFERLPSGLNATPTLSVLTRTREPVIATVTLSYLAEGFDWAANYVARLGPDHKTLALGAWITLANGNGVSLPDAATQIVAGKLNRRRPGTVESDEDAGEEVIADCWPQGTTGEGTTGLPPWLQPTPPAALRMPSPPPPMAVHVSVPAGERVRAVVYNIAPEQLGDLKLYRVPEPTTVAARQSKQVRFVEKARVPYKRLYTADIGALGQGAGPATILLRTKNTLADHLGLPLPSGSVAVFDHAGERTLYAGEAALRDTAVDEDVELKMGQAPDIQLRQTTVSYKAGAPELTVLSPEILLAVHRGEVVEQVDITNAGPAPAPFELRLQLYGAQHVTAADQPMATKDGRPIFRMTLPANGSVTLRYTVAK
jgi:hypothetical protein